MTQPKIDHFEAVRGPANAPGTGPDDSIRQTTIDGMPVYAFTVKPGDVQVWDRAEGNTGGNQKPNERAEISYAPAPDTEKYKSPVNVREGMLQTYDQDYWFEPGWPVHDPAKHEWAVLTQFHPQPNAKGIPGYGDAAVANMAIRYYNPDGSGAYFAEIPIKADRTRISVRRVVKWSAGKDGYAKILTLPGNVLVGRYDGPTIAPGEFKYLKQGYYRAGGLPQGTVYQTLIDISEGDLTVAAPTPTPAPVVPAAFDPSKPSVNPNAGAALAMSVVEQADAVIAVMTKIRKDAQALLDKGAFKP